MRSRIKTSSVLLLVAMLLSLVPAAAMARPAAAWSTCDWAQFVADVTVPDGTRYAPGTTFQKTWRLKNIGTCTWTKSYSLVFDSGDRFGAQDVNFPIDVPPGATVDLSLNMTAPSAAGHYFSYWRLKNASDVIFGIGSTANRSFWADIYVTSGGTTGVAYDFTDNLPSANITGGGTAEVVAQPKYESGVTFASHGMRFVPANYTNGYVQAAYPAFRVQSGDRFQTTVGCEFGYYNCYVAYRLDYQIGTGPIRTFWTFREKYEGLTYNANLDLSSLAGFDVKFILVINAWGSPLDDRALWGNPIIARAGAGTGATATATVTGTPPSSLSQIKHIFVVVMENKRYQDIWGSPSAPYINSLGSQYARAANYHALTYPSLPNYLQLFAGTNGGITTDCSPSDSCHLNARNLGDSLDAKGLSWKAYMESMPAPCYLKTSGNYAPKHNPFVYFDDIRTNSIRCRRHVVPFTAFASNIQYLSTTPNFAFISPNQCNDMHSCSTSTGDNWLKNHVPAILKSPACVSAKCLVVITWDEDNDSSGNHVLTIFAGSGAKTGGYIATATFNHYSLLHTIEAIFGLPTQTRKDANANLMTSLLR